jgi:predicted ATPase
MSKIERIVLIGGPGTGKTSVLKNLQELGNHVWPEISREVIQEARKSGIDQLFLTDPLAFSNQLLKGRIQQFENAVSHINFYDRGIPDVPAYHYYTGDPVPDTYLEACKAYKYDKIFYFEPWEAIFEQDEERYEDFEKACEISEILLKTYLDLGYHVQQVPKDSIEQRAAFILK